MNRPQFSTITHFTAEEVEGTGANLEDVSVTLMRALDVLRSHIGKPFILIWNGMTTGKHSAPEHRNGLAVDFAVRGIKERDIPRLLMTATMVGFRGVGVYRNAFGNYSFHMDLRPNIALWGGTKIKNESRWSYGGVTVKLGRKK